MVLKHFQSNFNVLHGTFSCYEKYSVDGGGGVFCVRLILGF